MKQLYPKRTMTIKRDDLHDMLDEIIQLSNKDHLSFIDGVFREFLGRLTFEEMAAASAFHPYLLEGQKAAIKARNEFRALRRQGG